MADGRRAAVVGGDHVCPMIDPITSKAHVRGRVVDGAFNVWVVGKLAAVRGSQCECSGAPAENIIITGHPGVFIGGRFAAREWDYTAHGGIVRWGAASVYYGMKTDAELIKMAIDRIRHSKFGQTEKGKELVDKLEKLQAADKIHYADMFERKQMDDADQKAHYDPVHGDITLNPDGPHEKNDVDDTARVLTHEGTHGVIADKEGAYSENYVDKETDCWQNQSDLYKDQSVYAPHSDKDTDAFDAAPNKEAYIKQQYKDAKIDLPDRPAHIPKKY